MEHSAGTGRVTAVRTKPKETRGRRQAANERAQVVAGAGLIGDARFGSGSRQVSIFLSEDADPRGAAGFCALRFAANLDIAGLPAADLRAGQRLRIGSAVLEIEEIGKECWPDCPAFDPEDRCARNRACLFARAAESGSLGVDDAVVLQ